MFEAAEVGSKVGKDQYQEQLPQLRVDLINAQYDLRQAGLPVLVVILGDDRAGCSELVNHLNEWMDARFIDTHVFGEPTPDEQQRPRMWRYWLATPGRGEMALFAGHWMLHTMAERIAGSIDDAMLAHRVAHMARLEQDLVDDGALVLKFWLHLTRAEFRKRVRKADKRAKKNGKGNGRKTKQFQVDDVDRTLYDAYDAFMPLAERALRKTSDRVPWEIVESSDARHRNLTVARRILSAVTTRVAAMPRPAVGPAESPRVVAAAGDSSAIGDIPPTVLDTVDLSASIAYDDYKKELDRLQTRLRGLTLEAREHGVSSVLVFEGWDAAGKGGVIRRLTGALDVRDYRIVPIAAPTDEELAHHHLWRFWRRLPRAGRMLVFDRSWYGRVLVERVEGFAHEDAWQRSYAEINDFEEQIVEHGALLQKFWLHLDPEEQLARFRAREKTPYKKYKITDDDYRNRARWPDYALAVHDMVARTSTDIAPWQLVSATDKRWARVAVLRSVCEGLAARLDPAAGASGTP